jgi:hypothetical protein
MPILPDPLPSELSESRSSFLEEVQDERDQRENQLTTFDDSTLEGPVRERFLRTVRAVEQVLAGSSAGEVAPETQMLKQEPQILRAREQMRSSVRDRQSPRSFVLSIPAPAQLAQVDEHSMELYVITPDGIPVTRRIHAAVLICVKTAAIMSAVLALGSLKEEDYMRLVKMALEPKDRLVLQTGCQHPWPCSGKPAIIFHDRGKIFTSERARQVLVDRLGIITEQAPPYCPSANDLIAYCTPCA